MDTRTRDDHTTGTRGITPGTADRTTDRTGDISQTTRTDLGTEIRSAAPDAGDAPHWADRADDARRATDRRRLLGGALGAGLAVTLTAGIGRAQDSGTPAADDTTDDADDSDTATADVPDGDRVQILIDRASLALETTRADIDSVAGQADTTSAEDAVAEGTSLRDAAQSALDGGETARAVRAAGASIAVTRAANGLLRSSLGFAGLPSQEAPSSRVLAGAFDLIERVGVALVEVGDASATSAGATPAATGDTTTASDGSAGLVEAERFVGLAQDAYGEAFDLHAAGAYQQAMLTAGAAVRMAAAAASLGLAGQGNGRGGRRVGRIMDRRHGDHLGGIGGIDSDRFDLDRASDDGMGGDGLGGDSGEPVTVPEPTFT